MRIDDLKIDELKRVVVIGSSCAGKTTLAKNLAGILSVKHIEMDALNWLPEWQERTTEELRKIVEEETSAERWVLDGNYSRTRDITWTRATHIIWLNYSFPVVFYRAIKRTSRRAFTREELFAGNRESIRQSFFSTDSMILWVLKTYHSRRRRYQKQVEDNQDFGLKILTLHSSAEADKFLSSLVALS
jgi:adenylate kinase family enzyme